MEPSFCGNFLRAESSCWMSTLAQHLRHIYSGTGEGIYLNTKVQSITKKRLNTMGMRPGITRRQPSTMRLATTKRQDITPMLRTATTCLRLIIQKRRQSITPMNMKMRNSRVFDR
jgi:hypothetical protein